MSELKDLTKTLVNISIVFFVYVLLYNIYIYLLERIVIVEEPVYFVKEGFDADAFKSASGSDINQGLRAKSRSISSQKEEAKKKAEEKNQDLGSNKEDGSSEAFKGNQNCLSIAECQTMQKANDNGKILNKLSQKVDQLSQSVTTIQASQMSKAKNNSVNSAKKASSVLPNSGLTKGIKSQTQNHIANNS